MINSLVKIPKLIDHFDNLLTPALIADKEWFDFPVAPRMNLSEVDNKLKVEMELPGYSKEEISLNFLNGKLIVSAKKEDNKENEYKIKEINSKETTRSIYLGNDIDSENIIASLKNGILLVELTKRQDKKQIIIQ